MPKSINVGAVHVSWGDDLLQEDQAFYGVTLSLTTARWVAVGVSVDRVTNHQRDERMFLWGKLERLRVAFLRLDMMLALGNRAQAEIKAIKKILTQPLEG